ncbi:ATP-dependent RNA helicase DEAH13 [Mercurialis annua]|uniref:ATP-dependent RNA helicase DEAH13 n=1 Tax=Mercurialis annua TaxID=3986 RepID=UPI00215E2E8D|nr:ATP-dependent RNA helicase DEAH13 [Mercurialis annua]
MELSTENSCLEGDSNALILPAKKKNNKRKGMNLETEKKNKQPMLSKSQQRKLKKLEEEKERESLLEKSIETLEKYKIPENALSLMRSSRNIRRAETVREKRIMAVQLFKAGLEVPNSEGSSFETEAESEHFYSRQAMNEDDHLLQPVVRETEATNDTCDLSASYSYGELGGGNKSGLDGPSVSLFSAEEFCSQDSHSPIQDKSRNFTLPACRHDNNEASQLLVKSDEILIADFAKASRLADCPLQRPILIPTVVHVVRPNKVEEQRKDLPIVMMEQEIMEAINYNSTVLICGETGCGKTTQVPQFLYEAGFGSSQSLARGGIIGVTQPRRVAVLSTARRVAYELGVPLGREVGFQVRHDKRIGDNCAIKFMTDGILLREIQNDFLLKRYSVIILDEAHERSANTDILIGMLSRVIVHRQKIYEDQQKVVLSGQSITPTNMIFPLKLILMSATLRVEDFISQRKLFRYAPPVIEVATRQFPVTMHFSKRTEEVDYIGQAYKKVMSIHKRLPQGGILVFVTGQREVEYLCQKLRKASKQPTSRAAERNVRNEIPTETEMNLTEGISMKEIYGAFEAEDNSDEHQTDRFGSFSEDLTGFAEDDSEFSYDSETESEVEVAGDDVDPADQINENGHNILDVLGEEGNISSLKAAFEALAGKTASDTNSEGKQIPSIPEDSFKQSNHNVGKNGGGNKGLFVGALHVLPLYAMLSGEQQLRVFEKINEEERLVVVATNVAETSLTIPGIKYVIDTGREKVKNYNPLNGMETYDIQWISKASAAQRAGRAGRTGPGHCYRLYSSACFNNTLPDFSCAEISKMPVENVVLILKSMKISKVENFPFPTPPEANALREAERCLKTLEALDDNGRLTSRGKVMSFYPISPRHSRMILTAIEILKKKKVSKPNLVLGYAVAAAAALSSSNPFLIQFEGGSNNNKSSDQDGRSGSLDNEKILDKQEKLMKKRLKGTCKTAREKFSNLNSDALTIAYALQCFELSGSSENAFHLKTKREESKLRENFCIENALHLKTMEEMSKLRNQLLKLIFSKNVDHGVEQDFSWTHGTLEDVEQAWNDSSRKLKLNEEELLCQAICAGWADRVAKRIRGHSRSSEGDRNVNSVRYQACFVKEEDVCLHRWSSLSRSPPEFLVYNELVCRKRPYIHGATSVKPEWLVKYARSLCSFSTVDDPKPYYKPQTDQVYRWVTPVFGPRLWKLPLYSLPITSDMDRVKVFAYALLEGQVLPCLKSCREYMAARPSIILNQEAAGESRVGNLLFKLKTNLIDCRAKLREVWKQNPEELYFEILCWFKKNSHNKLGELWSRMHIEVELEPRKRFSNKVDG